MNLLSCLSLDQRPLSENFRSFDRSDGRGQRSPSEVQSMLPQKRAPRSLRGGLAQRQQRLGRDRLAVARAGIGQGRPLDGDRDAVADRGQQMAGGSGRRSRGRRDARGRCGRSRRARRRRSRAPGRVERRRWSRHPVRRRGSARVAASPSPSRRCPQCCPGPAGSRARFRPRPCPAVPPAAPPRRRRPRPRRRPGRGRASAGRWPGRCGRRA